MRIKLTFPLLITALALIAAHCLLIGWFVSMWSDRIDGFFPCIAGGALIVFGLHYMVPHIRGKGLGHFHLLGRQAHDGRQVERGPHDGFLVNLGHGFVEITVLESNVAPRFRLFLYNKNKQPRSVPARATVTIETLRPDGARQTFGFCTKGEYLESTNEVPKPHEFKVILQISHGTHTHTHEVRFSEHD
jgi:nickel/cobalt exporter